MGIINATPDSFYAGSRFEGEDAILEQATSMLMNGADILDIGGQSTRPGSAQADAQTEIRRVIKAIEAIRRRFPDAVISIDTYRSEVAAAAVSAGASMVNDVSGGDLDSKMYATVASLKVPYICMHMRGNPGNMASLNRYEDVTAEVLEHLISKIRSCKEAGIQDVIIDPGFGFAKDINQNFEMLRKLDLFRITGAPLLVGISRKSMIYKTLNISPEESLAGTVALNMYALERGAFLLRVHDVKEARQLVTLYCKLSGNATG
jgi:dihydropteroate synthase